ncbi:LAME_0F15962g1_1 [Lachancea meyersii CBS 8951]|uniref:LAME_0F15962g1_1 n=1 Tax=Lachancea meyersii CBS 8951 TaxID=1266667 RepID=A0A1G4JYR9_9SACH|nr:LAME_0F15962g1_1 [Lachancea meyersii CBS 8951]
MRGGPRSIEELLYQKLLESAGFHRFVRRIYYKVNGLQEPMNKETRSVSADQIFRPTKTQKFKAFRTLFWDELRSTFGFQRRFNKKF